MSQAEDKTPGAADSASAALAFAVAGVLPDGSGAPRLCCRIAGEGYDEARAVTGRVVAIGNGVELCFHLPGGAVDFIQVEPAAVPGSYRIPRLVYAGVVVADLHKRVIAACEGADDHAGPGSVHFADLRGRPAVELDVRGLDAGNDGHRLELLLQREADGATAADAFAHLLDRMSVDRELDRAGVARLGRELGTASDGLRALTADVSGLPAMAAAQAHLIERADWIAAAVTKGATEQSLSALVALVERAAAERATSEASASAAAQAGRDAMASDMEGVRHALAELQSQVDRVTNSVENVFWRRWLRRLRGGGR